MFSNKKYLYLFLLPSIITLVLISLYPFFYGVYMSLSKASVVKIEDFVGLTNYVNAFSDDRFLNSLRVSIVFVLGATSLELVLGFGLALSLHYSSFLITGVARLILTLPLMITPIVVGITWRLMYDPDFGILNYLLQQIGVPYIPWLASPSTALISLILVDAWQWTPFMMLILLAGLKSLPEEPFEAAQLDGASGWQRLRYLTLPMLRHVIIVALLIRTIDAFKAFDIFFVTTKGGPGTVTEITSLYAYNTSFRFFHTGYAAAMAILLLILIIVIGTVYRKIGQGEVRLPGFRPGRASSAAR